MPVCLPRGFLHVSCRVPMGGVLRESYGICMAVELGISITILSEHVWLAALAMTDELNVK